MFRDQPRLSAIERVWIISILLALTWGVAAFGSVYRWAYSVLICLCVTAVVTGFAVSRNRSFRVRGLLLALSLVAVAISFQLSSLSRQQLEWLSPHTAILIGKLNIEYAVDGATHHSISIDPTRTKLALLFFAVFASLLLSTGRALTRHSANVLVRSIVILGSVMALTGIVQKATSVKGKIYGFWVPIQGDNPFGPFVNKNHFAGWMLMILPVALGYFLALLSRRAQNRKPGFRNFVLWFSTPQAGRAMLTGFGVLIMLLSLVLTMSRSGMMAAAVALIILVAVALRHQSVTPRRGLAVGYLAFVVISVVLWVGIDQIVARFAEMDPSSVNERPAIWGDTIRIAQDFWLTGTGLNTYGVSTLFYQTSVPGQHLAEAHNDYLQLAAEGGLLVGIPISITILVLIREIRRRFQDDVGSIWWIRMGAVIGLVAIALQSVMEFSLQMPGNAALFAVISGLAIHDGRRI